MEPTDSELWGAAGRGDHRAFSLLFDRHAGPIYNFAFRRTGDWLAAEEILAVVFLEAWRRDVRLSGDSLLPWLYGVATNVLHNHRRSARRHNRALKRLGEPFPAFGFEDEVVGRLDDQEAMGQVLAVIGQLPLRDQEVLALCGWEASATRRRRWPSGSRWGRCGPASPGPAPG